MLLILQYFNGNVHIGVYTMCYFAAASWPSFECLRPNADFGMVWYSYGIIFRL